MSIRTIGDVFTEEDMVIVLEAAKLSLGKSRVITDFTSAFNLPNEYLKGLNSRVSYVLDNKLPMNE